MMKYLALFLLLFGCATASNTSDTQYESYGSEILADEAVSVQALLSSVDTVARSFKVKGVIEEVCQMKGCWMTLRNESGANVRVTFKDYGFFVPKDISGSQVVIEGLANKEVLDESVARHYAEDSGVAYDESMRNTVSFVAHGVLVAIAEESAAEES